MEHLLHILHPLSPLFNQLASIITSELILDRMTEASKCDFNSPEMKIKDIRIASVTDNHDIKGNINKNRQAITDLTFKNHKSYADRWFSFARNLSSQPKITLQN